MMLGIPSSNINNGAAAAEASAAAAEAAHDSGGGDSGGGGGIQSGGFSEDDMRPERGASGGGNRWPRQETLALLKIRSEMDNTFRDSSLKGPLWDEVSRKMAELGYHRTAKKCKEKFENVFKYHKRTKEGRASKADGKTYRFFDQLEALEANPAALQLPPTPTPRAPPPLAAGAAQMPPTSNHPPNITVSSAPLSPNPVSFAQNLVSVQNVGNNPSNIPPPLPTAAATINAPPLQSAHHQHHHYPTSHVNMMAGMMSNSSSSSTSSDEEIERRHGRKRKWKDFFERLMKDVITKQEELQRRFLESLEKRERDRMVREEAWRVQEIARMTREHDLLVQERTMAAAKDAAVIAFLQKVTDQQNPNSNTPTTTAIQIPPHLQIPSLSSPPPPPPQAPPPPPPPTTTTTTQVITSLPMPVIPAASLPPAPPPPQPIHQTPPPPPPPRSAEMSIVPKPSGDNGVQRFNQPSPSRWPKSEVQALIKLRTNLDMKYQENGPKGPLWEEISAGMRKMGYNRNAKRCKEKWENINKYFKKVKESNKKRPQDSKTCPYFYQLEALYKEKGSHSSYTNATAPPPLPPVAPTSNPMMPIMARPEQQWPIVQPEQQHNHHQDSAMEEDRESDNMDDNDHDDDGDDEDDDDEGGGYEIVTNKQPSSVATTAAE